MNQREQAELEADNIIMVLVNYVRAEIERQTSDNKEDELYTEYELKDLKETILKFLGA